MKKILTLILLSLFTIGLFVACAGDMDSQENNMDPQENTVCFTALTDNSGVKLEISLDYQQGSHDLPEVVNFLYSRDNSAWDDYETGKLIHLEKANDKVYFKAKKKVTGLNGYNEYYHFTGEGEVSVKGNVMYLINPSGESVEMTNHAFAGLFKDNTTLISAKDLLLPATKLVKGCYFQMFWGCSKLTDCPELPATELADDCYHAMFYECSSLTKAPVLSATVLTPRCYEYMFYNCKPLSSVTVKFTDWDVTGATEGWLKDAGTAVQTEKTFTCPSELDTTNKDDSHVPNGWNVVNQ